MEKEYKVKDVAEMLSTSEETVRRWIRDGKLEATADSKKQGNKITEKSLENFFEKQPKYKTIAASTLGTTVGAGLAGGPIGAIIAAGAATLGVASITTLGDTCGAKVTSVSDKKKSIEINIDVKKPEKTIKEDNKDEQKQLLFLEKNIIDLQKMVELLDEKITVAEEEYKTLERRIELYKKEQDAYKAQLEISLSLLNEMNE